MPTTQELAWAAGIIDGEGYIGISKRSRHSSILKAFDARLSVSMTDFKTTKRLRDMFDCGSFYVQNRDEKHNQKPSLTWAVAAKGTKKILSMIYPYLYTKKQQAKYALEFMGRVGDLKYLRGPHKSKDVPQGELQQREFFYNLSRTLNKRGVG